MFTATAVLLQFVYSQHLYLAVFLVAIPVVVAVVLSRFVALYSLAKKYVTSDSDDVKEEIVRLSARNPKWIMLITQTYNMTSIVLLISRFMP